MLFNSFAFAVFLPTVFLLYWRLPQRTPRAQNAFLIAASCLFYGWWDWRFLSLLFVSSGVDYVAGCLLPGQTSPGKRRALLAASLATNLGILGFFKYFGFFTESFAALLGQLGLHAEPSTLKIILPVGLSFYTFQSIAYTVDIYRGKLQPEWNWIDFFAFVSFFPQLVAGPIQRAGDLLPQFQRARTLSAAEVRRGAEQALWGLFKKVVIADNLAGLVEQIFSQHEQLGARTLFCGAVLFAVQIYCDFSGYSDIALGVSRFFGFTLTRNFAYPYFARNLVEFWQCWHISLSTWFRDYLYIPLGGNRVGALRRSFNLFATFAVSGLWHGANWTFVAWGVFHGALYVGYLALRGKRTPPPQSRGLFPPVRDLAAMGLTFATVLVSWVFFRAESLGDALRYLAGMFTRFSGATAYLDDKLLIGAMLAALGLLLADWLGRHRSSPLELRAWPRLVRWPAYYAVMALIFGKGNFQYVPFIYFDF